jgi:hypothetical protein
MNVVQEIERPQNLAQEDEWMNLPVSDHPESEPQDPDLVPLTMIKIGNLRFIIPLVLARERIPSLPPEHSNVMPSS